MFKLLPRFFFAIVIVFFVGSCCKLDDGITAGTVYRSTINGKEFIFTVTDTVLSVGQEIELVCNSNTVCEAVIDIKLNGHLIGTLHEIPSEFKYKVNKAGSYELSVDMTTGSISDEDYGSFTYRLFHTWTIKVK